MTWWWLGVGDLLLKFRRSVRPYQAGFLRVDLAVIFTCCVSLALVLLQQPGATDQAHVAHLAAYSAAERIPPMSQVVGTTRIMLAASAAYERPALLPR